jgi:fumarylacetoacetate (FAA) hydrolase family protein
MPDLTTLIQPAEVIPTDWNALLVGRVELPGVGPALVTVRGELVLDITAEVGPTMSDLLDRDDPAHEVREATGEQSWPLAELLTATLSRDHERPHVISPVDLAALKAQA